MSALTRYQVSEDMTPTDCRRCKAPVYRVLSGRGIVQAEADGTPHRCFELRRVYTIPPGTPASVCKGSECRARIYYVDNGKGKSVPVDPDGGTHFETCLDVDRFAKRKKGTQA